MAANVKAEDFEQDSAPSGARRWKDKKTNPCSKEARASFKCLDENNYNRGLCEGYFEAYRNCKKAWNARKAERRRQGLHPDDP